MGTIMDIIQWLIPSGAIVTFFTWIVRRDVHNARSAKEKHDLYKKMYEDSQETNFNLQNDVRKLQIAFINLERAVSKAVLCRYYDNHCPVRAELQSAKRKYATKPVDGQFVVQKNATNYPRSDTDEQGGDDSDSGDAATVTRRDRLS